MLPELSRVTGHIPRPDMEKKTPAKVERSPQLLIDKPAPLQEASGSAVGETFSNKVLFQ